MRGHALAGPSSPTVEEASPSELGIHRSLGSDSGVPGKHISRALGEAPRRTIPRHFQLADQRAGTLLQYQSRKGPGKAP
jgi:hypothetical protein